MGETRRKFDKDFREGAGDDVQIRKVTVRPFLLVSPCAPVVPGCGSRISD